MIATAMASRERLVVLGWLLVNLQPLLLPFKRQISHPRLQYIKLQTGAAHLVSRQE